MKHTQRLLILFFVFLALLVTTGCSGVTVQDDGLVIGESYRLESGETLNNDLTIIGGNAAFDQDSTLNGDLTVIGGNASVDGTIDGDVSVMGGHVYLDDNAVVQGDLVTLGGSVQRSSQARVEGSERRDGRPAIMIPMLRALPIQMRFDPITGPLMAIFKALALAALAIVVQLFAARNMERTGQTVLSQPIVSGGVGLLTIIVVPAMLIILAITIILIPLSLLGFLALGLAALFGWLVLGLLLGRQLAVLLKQNWSEPVNAGVGTLVLSLLSSMLNIIPCIGWLANALIWLIALGAVLLTRFGTQNYPTMFTPSPVGPYAPAVVAAPPAPYAPEYAPAPTAAEEDTQPGARVYDEPQAESDGENI